MEYFNMRDLFSNGSSDKKLPDLFEKIAQETDGKIPKDIAEMILRENRDPNYIIRIHRCLADVRDEIFNQGLIIKGGTDLDYTTSDYTSNDMALLISIRDGYAYKNSMGEDAVCVIIKIPKEYLEYEKGITKPILFPTENAAEQSGGLVTLQNGVQTILLSEFVLGAIEYSGGKITGFTPNEKYKNEHDYLGDGLVFPDTVIYDYYRKTGTKRISTGIGFWESQEEQKEQDAQIAQVIIEENNKYEMEKKQGRNVNGSQTNKRTENEIKSFSLTEMSKSRFKTFLEKFKSFFKGKDITKEEKGEEFNGR